MDKKSTAIKNSRTCSTLISGDEFIEKGDYQYLLSFMSSDELSSAPPLAPVDINIY